MTPSEHIPTRRTLVALAFALLCAVVVVGGALSVSADGSKAKKIGKTKHVPHPNCPHNCRALGSVTGFQVRTDGKKHLMKIPHGGKLVAWSARLSKPDKKQRKFFGSTFQSKRFGKAPTGRISVLSKIDKKHFKLKAQSPAVKLGHYYKETPIFTLNKPIRVRKGQILAFTTMTWTPNLATSNRAPNSKWRASRKKGKCGSNAALHTKPHHKVGSTRQYGCSFNDRLLYWGYLR